MDKPNCQECLYRKYLARLCDVHVWLEDCDKYGTDFCTKKMNDPGFIEHLKKEDADNA